MKEAYSLFPVSFAILFFYTVSFTISFFGLISKKDHRRIWNWALLISFFITAPLGILLVININYKFNWSWIASVLSLHVHAGIGFAVVALFHFYSNLRYFLLKGEPRKTPVSAKDQPYLFLHLKLTAFILGFITMNTQILLIRQNLNLFSGNEIIISVLIISWMIYTALGAWSGKRNSTIIPFRKLFIFLLVISFLGFATWVLQILSRLYILIPGRSAGFMDMFYLSFLLFPFCFFSGYLFTSLTKQTDFSNAPKLYGIESIGALFGGFSATLFTGLSFFTGELLLTNFPVVGILIFFLPFTRNKKIVKPFIFLAFFIPFILARIYSPDKKIYTSIYSDQKLLKIYETPYGIWIKTAQSGQINEYLSGTPLFSSGDVIQSEESIHYPLSQRPLSDTILLIHGNAEELIPEIQKYPVKQIDYVEPVTPILSQYKNNPKEPFSLVQWIQEDPRIFLAQSEKLYDGIIISGSEPSSLLTNRLFTLEFFRQLKNRLHPDGIICFSLPTSMNYLNPEASEVNSSEYYTLKQIFNHVCMVPGNRMYFMASDDSLDYNFARNIAQTGISTEYVNDSYLDDETIRRRAMEAMQNFPEKPSINLDLQPAGFYSHTKFWMVAQKINLESLGWLIAGLGLLILFFTPAKSVPMFAAGASGAGMEYLMIVYYQVHFGKVYQYTGLMVAIFMGAIALGSWYGSKYFQNENHPWKINLLLVNSLLLLLFSGIYYVPSHLTSIHGFLFSLCSLILVLSGIMTGVIFSLSINHDNLTKGGNAGLIYSVDLLGSAIGILGISLFLFPKIGLKHSILILCSLNILGYFLIILKKTFFVKG